MPKPLDLAPPPSESQISNLKSEIQEESPAESEISNPEISNPKSEIPNPQSAILDVAILDTAKPLPEIFHPFQTTLDKWKAKVASLTVTSIEQKTEMAQARLARLELKESRVNLDKTRKGLVEGIKARAGKIDDVARSIRVAMEGLEAKLLESEQFAERHAAQVRAELKLKREAELGPLLNGPLLIDLGLIDEGNYQLALSDAKLLWQAKLEAAAKAEADRLAKEAADKAERERVAMENERLKAEAAETARLAKIESDRIEAERIEERRQAAAAAAKQEAEHAAARRLAEEEFKRAAKLASEERQRLAAAAEAERQRVEAVQAELRAELLKKQKAEAAETARLAAERKAQEKAAKAAAAAPDKEKLKAYAAALRAVPLPAIADERTGVALTHQRALLLQWIDQSANTGETLL